MFSDSEWDQIRGPQGFRFGGGAGMLRVALLFGSAAVAIALLATPFLDSEIGSRLARGNAPAGVDFMSTGSVPPRGTYTIHRSVLQSSPHAVCIIEQSGKRSGDCR